MDTLIVSSFSKFGNNKLDILKTVKVFDDRGVNVCFEKENIRTKNDDRSSTFEHLLLDISGGSPLFDNVNFTNQALSIPGSEGSGTWITLDSTNVQFTNCNFNHLSTEMSGSATSRKGNVVYQSSGTSVFDNCTFNGNTLSGASSTQSELKGNVYYLESGSASFTGSTFTNNSLTGGLESNPKGGVFYVENGSLTLSGCQLDSNSVSSQGNGVLLL